MFVSPLLPITKAPVKEPLCKSASLTVPVIANGIEVPFGVALFASIKVTVKVCLSVTFYLSSVTL